jgi:hypothetical protein
MVEANQGWEALKAQLKEIGITLMKTKDLEYPDGFPEWMDDEWLKWKHRKKRIAKGPPRQRIRAWGRECKH